MGTIAPVSRPIPHDRRVECVGPRENLVALDRGEILIRHQAGMGRGPSWTCRRTRRSATSSSFDSPDRSQHVGRLDAYWRALIFPNRAMNVFEEDNLRNRVWGPPPRRWAGAGSKTSPPPADAWHLAASPPLPAGQVPQHRHPRIGLYRRAAPPTGILARCGNGPSLLLRNHRRHPLIRPKAPGSRLNH